ncbi:MAG TPA: biopolymer transporter ExbD [Victivallales bacterium]|nr:biopolymer transporter ExbD [Victivallales bacterium]
MRRAKRRSQLNTIREINMTPLIDLTFLLLIVFMITVPLMEYNIDVSPPEMNAKPLPNQNNIFVNLNKNNQITIQDKPVSKIELNRKLTDILYAKPDTTIFLRADGSCSYNEVMVVMKLIKSSGIKNISLVTQSET